MIFPCACDLLIFATGRYYTHGMVGYEFYCLVVLGNWPRILVYWPQIQETESSHVES